MAPAWTEPLAGRPVDVDRHVPELGSGADRAAIEAAVEDEPAADPRPEREHDHVLAPAARSVAVLRERSGVRVVLDRRRKAEPLGEAPAEVDVVERDVDGRDGAPGPLVDRRGNADPDRLDPVVRELRDGAVERCEQLLLARHVRGPHRTPNDDALRVDHPRKHLRSRRDPLR